MSDGLLCPRKDVTAAAHCWHTTNLTLTTYPAQSVEQCCNCGQTRNVMARAESTALGHGPFHPRVQP